MQSSQKLKKEKGFTLIEIMVVVVIIILITSVTVIAINRARERTRNAIITSSLEQIQGIAKTTYNPSPQDKNEEYKEFFNMRESAWDFEKDYHTLQQIRKRIEEMGSIARIRFPIDDGMGEYEEYCAYAFLIPRDTRFVVFCVDHLGNRVVAPLGDLKCDSSVLSYNCEYK